MDRRRFIAVSVPGAIGLLAGCGNPGEDDEGDDGGEGGEDEGDGGGGGYAIDLSTVDR